MIGTTRTIGLLVTMALVTGGAAWSVHSLIASAADAGSDYGLDTNGNGTFEWLVVEAQVSLPAAGTWDVSADLSTATPPATGECGGGVPVPMMRPQATSTPIAWVYERYFFPEGMQTVRMAFAGTDIARAGVDGPFRVHARLSLGPIPYAGSFAPEPMPSGESVEWNYTTHAYAASEFEMPVRPAFFTGAHGDSAVDVDSDGLADFLEITAEVHVNTAGHYTLNGYLSQAGGPEVVRTVAYAYRDFNLTPADTKVFLRFRGDQIRQAGVDGPWNFTLTLFGGFEPPYLTTLPPTSDVLRRTPYFYPEMLCGVTGSYASKAFDDTVELLRYTGRFQESTPDGDADGKYDALLVRAEVEVFVGAGFDAAGTLRPVGGTTDVARTASQVWLHDGTQWVDFAFPGSQIRAGGVDGPYEATLSLTPGRWGIDPKTTYETKAYKAADFDADSVSARGYWIGNLTATPAGTSLSIVGEVVRGNDMLAVVFEDVLSVSVTNSAGTVVASFQTKVVLNNSGSGQSFSFSTVSLSPDTYTVTAVLGPADRPVDIRSVVVTL
jgi:hypothetical protein